VPIKSPTRCQRLAIVAGPQLRGRQEWSFPWKQSCPSWIFWLVIYFIILSTFLHPSHS